MPVFIGLAIVLGAYTSLEVVGAEQRPGPNASSRGSISGTVTESSSGRAIAGAIVTLISPRRDAAGGRVMTDDGGRFVFTQLAAGVPFAITVMKVGYIRSAFGADLAGLAGAPITLREGEWFRSANVSLDRPGAMSGFVTDEAGESVVGTFVRAFVRLPILGHFQWAAGPTVRTDDRGRFRIWGLPEGDYVVMVPSVQAAVPSDTTLGQMSGYADAKSLEAALSRGLNLRHDPAVATDAASRLIIGAQATPPPATAASLRSYATMFFPAATRIADAIPIALASGEVRRGIDIRLLPVPVVRVQGHVIGPKEAWQGLTLRLLPSGSEAFGFGSETATALVAADGAFTFLNVPAGDYTILASRSVFEYTLDTSTPSADIPLPPGALASLSGYGPVVSATRHAGYAFRNTRGQASHFARMPLTVGGQDVSDISVVLQAVGRISGDIVWNPSEPPSRTLGPTTFVAEPANGDPTLGLPTGHSHKDSPTTFAVNGTLAGEYILRPLAPDGARVRAIMWQGRDYIDRAFEASAGSGIENVTVVLTRLRSTLTGYVRTEHGAASSGAVIVFPTERERWTSYGLAPVRIAVTSVAEDGGFHIDTLPAGDYFVIAVGRRDANRRHDPEVLAAVAPSAVRTTIAWGSVTQVDLVSRRRP